MEEPDFQTLLDFLLVVVASISGWLFTRSISHGERLRVVESTLVSTEVIREIVRSENESLHGDMVEMKNDIKTLLAHEGRRRHEDSLVKES